MRYRNTRRYRRSAALSMAAADVPLGVLAGGALGAFAGPVGIVAGALIGSTVGAMLAVAQNRQAHLEAENEELIDRELGVIGGSIGAPNLGRPAATPGAYSPPR